MNLDGIPPDALDRFRRAAALLTQNANLRASRLLTLKEDIATLRKHGVSYRSIGDLLTQNGIPTSDVSVMKFCHRFLNEKRPRKSSANRRPANRANRANRASSSNTSPVAPSTATPPPAPAMNPKLAPVPAETTAFTSRGPRIAKVEQLPPGETI
jgi:hypothetical protein